MRTLSSFTLITCILAALINLSSYFFHFAFSFILCIFLIFPLFIVAITVFSEKLEINFDELILSQDVIEGNWENNSQVQILIINEKEISSFDIGIGTFRKWYKDNFNKTLEPVEFFSPDKNFEL